MKTLILNDEMETVNSHIKVEDWGDSTGIGVLSKDDTYGLYVCLNDLQLQELKDWIDLRLSQRLNTAILDEVK